MSRYSDNNRLSSVAPVEEHQPLSNRAQVYTQYYHQWQANSKQHECHAQYLPQGSPARAEALRHAEWAKYYADQSSRAAHHFYNHPTTPAPFDLPPAAPPLTLTPNTAQQQSCVIEKERKSRPDRQTSAGDGKEEEEEEEEIPDSLKRYVHRCLKQCKTDAQRKAVQNELEKMIAQAIVESGSLQLKDWNSTALIVPPTDAPAAIAELPIAGASPPEQRATNRASENCTRTNSSFGNGVPYTSYYGQSTASNVSRKFDGSFSASSSDFPWQKKHKQEEYSKNQVRRNEKKPKSTSDVKSIKFCSAKSAIASVKSNLGDMKTFESTHEQRRGARFFRPSEDAAAANTMSGLGRYMGKQLIGGSDKKLDDSDYEKMTVKGTCGKLEKDYLRLTAAPRPETVRPQHILEQHLNNLQMERGRNDRRDNLWFCSQLKALRQDCMVQRIQSAFTVGVYETHARIALEEGDVNEYNQCQTQLKYLYDSLRDDPAAVRNKTEFIAYLIIYTVYLSENQKYDGGSFDLLKILVSLNPEERRAPAISHALKVRNAVADVDYHAFFYLHNTCPNSGKYLMNLIIPDIRSMAIRRICKAYQPSVDTSFVLGELGFGREDQAAGVDWLASQGCVMSSKGDKLLTKQCQIREDGKYSLI